ncbi:hypothetical protein M426DRAFT_260393 [Hypoxylon sp. CI-4A]|nr:hypothetical protein M426DRAFT_260393 [Hypoxylon sp. CI-4A]
MAEKEITIVWGSQHGSTTSQVVDLLLTRDNTLPSTTLPIPDENTIWFLDAHNTGPKPVNQDAFGSQEAMQFFLSCLEATEPSKERIVRLVIPLQRGSIIRSDIIPLRLKGAFGVGEVVSFSKPLQFFSGAALQLDDASLPDIIRASAGGSLLQQSSFVDQVSPSKPTVPLDFEVDYEKKLSMPWVVPNPGTRKRIVLVGCSYRDPESGAWTTFACDAARVMGIDLVVIEKPGNWIERAEYSDWYEAFLPAGTWWSNPPGDDMGDQLVSMIRSYGKKIDGVVTFRESYLAMVSRVAQQLGLPSQPAESYELAIDKYRLGLFEGHKPFQGSTAEEALRFISQENLTYPLILKPRLGFNSEGVVRVDDAEGVQSAVELIQKTFFKTFTMEKYCDGPEVDVDVVLLDGEVLFYEISDDFPKSGDRRDTGDSSPQGNFLETYLVHPSALPADELEMLESSISTTVRKLGFSSGIMHVEARVDRSSVAYGSIDGIQDLQPSEKATRSDPPATWIIEINPRPPGLTASRIVASVYGIDYFGVALALVLDDKERARALSRPFLNGAQHTGVMVLIGAEFPETCEGIFDSDDICEELLARRPDLAQHINLHGCLAKRGQKIAHPSSGENTFLAYFNVFSESRKKALEIATEVRKQVRYSIR